MTNLESQSSVCLDKNSIPQDIQWPQMTFQPQEIAAILQTLFIEHKEEILQIILHKWLALVADFHTGSQDIMEAAQEWSRQNSLNQQLFGLPPTAFALICKAPGHFAVVIRVSHAQYDALSIGKFPGGLLDLYQSRPISVPADFATYLQHVHDQQTPSAFDLWRVLLDNSTMTPVMASPARSGRLSCARLVQITMNKIKSDSHLETR